MTGIDKKDHITILKKIAHQAMIERGLVPDFPPQAIRQLKEINEPAVKAGNAIADLRHLPWCSIDNDDSLDLDQLTVVRKANPDGSAVVLVAIADVDMLVKKNSPIDRHANGNTTSVYTAAITFPMLPEKLSNDLTSLNFNEDRPAIVIEMLIDKDGTVKNPAIYSAVVQNHAKLAYNSVSDWLDGNGARPLEIGNVAGLEENLRQQDRLALKLRTFRHINGSLDLETIETHPVFIENELSDLKIISKNRATGIIEDFMIASNGVTVRFLESRKFPTLSRVVSVPKRWDRIVEIADEQGFPLPAEPDSKALEQFLAAAKVSDPLRFPDLSLSIIKLLGQGEYAAQIPGASHEGHFGLAVKDYAHSTAPNRRFPDLITQRLLKAALAGQPVPYTNDELEELAKQCTRQEDNAKKVERRVEKSAAAILLEPRIGEDFDAIVTGAAEKGTWVRLIEIPVEGKLVSGFDGVDVGQKLKVRLAGTDVERGYIDFKKI